MQQKEEFIKIDLAGLRSMRDEDIDFSDIPELDDSFFEKPAISLPFAEPVLLDKEIVSWFKSQGEGYQARINAVLKAYKEAHSKSSEHTAA